MARLASTIQSTAVCNDWRSASRFCPHVPHGPSPACDLRAFTHQLPTMQSRRRRSYTSALRAAGSQQHISMDGVYRRPRHGRRQQGQSSWAPRLMGNRHPMVGDTKEAWKNVLGTIYLMGLRTSNVVAIFNVWARRPDFSKDILPNDSIQDNGLAIAPCA